MSDLGNILRTVYLFDQDQFNRKAILGWIIRRKKVTRILQEYSTPHSRLEFQSSHLLIRAKDD